MGVFEKFKNIIDRHDSTIALPSDPFILIDKAKTVRRLKLDEKGKANGEADYPPEDSEDYDDIEAEIIAEISEYAKRAHINATTHYRVYGERISELALLRELSTLTGANQQASSNYRTTVFTRTGELALAKEEIEDSYRDLDNFRTYHEIQRPVQRRMLPAYAWSIIGFAWLFESGANTFFLRVNDDAGWLGGFVAAMVVAALNIGVSAFVGCKVLPYLFFKHPAQRTYAYIAAVVWLVALVAWNLLAGHFRDAKAAGLQNPENAALYLFQNNLVQFDSIYSYGLLAAGILFAIAAAMAGYEMDDPYPGYGKIYRPHENRFEDYAGKVKEAIEELRYIRDEAIESTQYQRDELGKQFRERGNIIASRESLQTRYREHQDYLEAQANALLSHYRGANIRARNSGAPKHFKSRWKLKRTELPLITDEPVVDAEVARAQQALEKSINTINTEYNEAIEGFEHLDQIKRSLTSG